MLVTIKVVASFGYCKIIAVVCLSSGYCGILSAHWCYGATVAIVSTYLPMMGDEMKDDTKYAVVTSPAM